MTGRRPLPTDDDHVVPTPDHQDVDLDILKREVPFTEAEVPVMQAPEDWPPPPEDVDSDDS